jgi:peptidyl-prolyl cis-trans isomerase C
MFPKRMLILSLLLSSFACKGVPDSEVVARINGEPILKKDFEEQVERNMARYRGQNHQLPPSIEQRIKESVLRRMIDDEMIAQKAKSLGITTTPADLDAKFVEYKSRFRTDEAFSDYLKRSNNTEENMKTDLMRNMLRDQVVEKLSGAIDVAEDETKKYYDDNKQRFIDREQVKASRILVRLNANAPDKEKKEAKKKADQVRAKLNVKNADFAELAKTESQGPEASRGGDLGWFARGRMPPEFDNIAFAMQPETVSAVVETKMGYEIIKVWEKKAERERPLDEVRENIKNSLLARKRNEKRRDILKDLKAGAKIEQLVKFEEAPGGPGAPGMPGMPPGMPGEPGMGGPANLGKFQVKPPPGMPMPNQPPPMGATGEPGAPENQPDSPPQ